MSDVEAAQGNSNRMWRVTIIRGAETRNYKATTSFQTEEGSLIVISEEGKIISIFAPGYWKSLELV